MKLHCLKYMFFLSEYTYNSILSDDKIRGINFVQVEGEWNCIRSFASNES